MTNKLFTNIENGNDIVIERGKEILYLVLIKANYKNEVDYEREDFRDWKFIKGRQEVYDYIKSLLINENDQDVEYLIDIENSLIYAENPFVRESKLKLSNGISLYTFMKDCYTMQKVYDTDKFDIDDYKEYTVDELD